MVEGLDPLLSVCTHMNAGAGTGACACGVCVCVCERERERERERLREREREREREFGAHRGEELPPAELAAILSCYI